MARCPAAGTLGPESPCNSVPLVEIPYMGYSVRDDRWRFTAWMKFNGTKNRADWTAAPLGVELYDHDGDDGTDAEAFENVNDVDDHDDVRRELFEVLRRKFDDYFKVM